jgi:hypothetical protein
MKSRSITVTLLSVLISPMLIFAGGQPAKVRMSNQSETQDRTGISRTLQQGKGTGTVREQGAQVNASRSQTAAESRVAKDQSRAGYPNWGDTALRK